MDYTITITEVKSDSVAFWRPDVTYALGCSGCRQMQADTISDRAKLSQITISMKPNVFAASMMAS